MDPIPDLGSLQVLLSSLEKKNLIVYLTPAGRGQIVTHNVYLAHELDALRTEYANYKGHADDADTSPSIATSSATPHRSSTHQTTGLENKVAELEAQVNDLRQRIEQIEKLLK
jgi:hypothetical protein